MRAHRLFWAASGTAAALVCAGACTAVLGYDEIDFESGKGGTTKPVDPVCTPSDGSAPVGDACGVFVSAKTGDDERGDGTKAKPLRTLAAALARGSVVYACAGGSFDEAIVIAEQATIFGGLDCEDGWSYPGDAKTVWTAPPGEVPLRVSELGVVQLRDIALSAEGASAKGGSSIAIIAAAGAAVDIRRCAITAGDGADGVTPMEAAEDGLDGAPGQNGAEGCTGDGLVTAPGLGGALECDKSDISGGAGGPGLSGNAGADGSDGNPGPGPANAGHGGKRQDATPCSQGMVGANGDSGGPGMGAKLLGSLSSAGYAGANGSPGGEGLPGHGGGGGGGAKACASTKAGPGGGGGGSGGCGGKGGKGGGAGGASIGIVSLGANLVLADVTITTGKGGKGGGGGPGGAGGDGGSGGDPGAGDGEATACMGGNGGSGGKGGRGGGGRGGHSLGIAHHGAAPAILDAAITIGPPGDGGDGDGTAGDGEPGVQAEVQAFD